MRFIFILSILLAVTLNLPSVCTAQQKSSNPTNDRFATIFHNVLTETPQNDLYFPNSMTMTGDRKSGSLAVLYSAILPGMGELYAGRFDRGQYPLITEAALWLGLLGVNSYGNWVQQNARTFAHIHAGFTPDGKSSQYYVHIENYPDLHDYNNQRLNERRWDELYPDEEQWYWEWDSDANRQYYKDRRILSDRMHNAVSFFVLGMVANRVWSAVQSAMFVRQRNAAPDQSAWLPQMQSYVICRGGSADELRFELSMKIGR